MAAKGASGHFAYPTGDEGLRQLGYPPALTEQLPAALRQRFCGTGNMLRAAQLSPGERVLDLGCGCGVDSLLAVLHLGKEGSVLALDASRAMLQLGADACCALRRKGLKLASLTFCQGTATSLPLADASTDCVLSNGLFSLLPDKEKALAQCLRVLRPGGRLVLADQTRQSLSALGAAPPATEPGDAHGWAL